MNSLASPSLFLSQGFNFMASSKKYKPIGPLDVILGCINVGLFAVVFGIPLVLISASFPSVLPYLQNWIVYGIYSPVIAAFLFTIFWGVLDKTPQVREGETSLFMGTVLGAAYLAASTAIWYFAFYGVPTMMATAAAAANSPVSGS
ncbi:MAG: hypothetical protein ACAI35_11515 [Candidatus Methylacidiphilales bacterium]